MADRLHESSKTGALLCVYREQNAARVATLVEMAQPVGLRVALWALDAIHPRLAEHTVGQEPGGRVDLLNRLFDAAGGKGAETLVVADDDCEFAKGDLAALLDAVERADFYLAQPAHAPGSHVSHDITRQRRLSIARRTDFVEIGPLHVVRRPWIERVFPMPGDFGMGYGLDLLWQDLAGEGCRLGVVDAVTIRHQPPSSQWYDPGPEERRLEAMLEERGIDQMWHAQHVLGTWRPWRSRAPWRSAR